jgi:hypothetical protein
MHRTLLICLSCLTLVLNAAGIKVLLRSRRDQMFIAAAPTPGNCAPAERDVSVQQPTFGSAGAVINLGGAWL